MLPSGQIRYWKSADSSGAVGEGRDAFAAGFIYGFLGYKAQDKDNCEINTHSLRMSMLWGCASGCCCVMIDGASLPPEKRILEQALTDVLTINEAEGVKPRSEDR